MPLQILFGIELISSVDVTFVDGVFLRETSVDVYLIYVLANLVAI